MPKLALAVSKNSAVHQFRRHFVVFLKIDRYELKRLLCEGVGILLLALGLLCMRRRVGQQRIAREHMLEPPRGIIN